MALSEKGPHLVGLWKVLLSCLKLRGDLKFTAGTGVLRLALAMHKNKKAWQVASIRNTNCARSQSQPKIMAGRASCGNLLYFNFTFLGFGIEYKRDALLHFD